MGPRDPNGYGRAGVGSGKAWLARRLALRFAGVDITRGSVVCHRCNNPPCCNPEHLYIGTHADNGRDRVASYRATGHGAVLMDLIRTDPDRATDVIKAVLRKGDWRACDAAAILGMDAGLMHKMLTLLKLEEFAVRMVADSADRGRRRRRFSLKCEFTRPSSQGPCAGPSAGIVFEPIRRVTCGARRRTFAE